MFKSAALAAAILMVLAACSKGPDATNVADANNSAGMALENSALELEATTDNLVDAEIANMDAGANASVAADGNSVAP